VVCGGTASGLVLAVELLPHAESPVRVGLVGDLLLHRVGSREKEISSEGSFVGETVLDAGSH